MHFLGDLKPDEYLDPKGANTAAAGAHPKNPQDTCQRR